MKPRSLTGATAAAVGGLVLVGWAFDIAALKSILPGWVSMKPNTAIAFVLIGMALWLQRNPRAPDVDPQPLRLRLARLCAVLAGSIGLLTLCEYVFDWNPGIDQWLFREPSGATGTSDPGRMAPDTALCFVLLAAGLTIARVSRPTKRTTLVVSAILGSLVTVVALAAILAYFAPALRAEGWWGLTIMSPATAVLFAVLGAAIVLSSWRDALGPKLTRFSTHLRWLLGCVGALAIAFALYARAEQQHARASELRHRSFLLADELRQSGDDLTRMARTYVVTGDPVYKRHFQEILDIRDGRKPRPESYARPYWDLVLGDGPAPRASQQAIALLELMRQAGFTEEEFRKLAEAKANSDGLTLPEFEAMRLVESTGPDAEASRAKARLMMYDAKYHQAKAAVMRPIHDFFVLVDERTLAAVQAAEESARVFRYVLAACGLGLVFVLWRTYVTLGDTLGGSVDEVSAHIARIGSGDFSGAIPVNAGLENSVLGWLSETQAKLSAIDRERLQTEERVRSEKLLSDSLINSLPGIFYLFDERGRFLRWNANFERVTGYSSAEVAALSPLDLFVGEERALIAQRIQAVFADGQADAEAFLVSKDGGRTAYYFTGLRIEFSSQPCLIGVGLDITARQRAEDALRESDSRFRQLAESLPQLVWACQPDGPCDYLSHQWIEFTGVPEARQLGFGWLEQLHPDDRAPTVAAWEAAVASGTDFRVEFRIRRHDGEYRWFDTRAVRLRDAEGRTVKWVGSNTDITERKQAEGRVRKLNEELEERVRSRTAELEAAYQELEAFSYSVSHDLRAPLRAIDGYGRILTEDYARRLDPEGRRVLGVISSETRRMGQLVDDLLGFSRLGRRHLESSDIDMTAMTQAVFEEQAAHAPERTLQLELDPLLPAHGDRAMLRVVLGNLLSNAIKFTRPRDPAVIEVGSRQQDGQVVYHVKDNGVGFDMKYAHKLFGVFQRLHSAEEFEGTGVGLALVQRVVHRHGGRV